MTAYLVRRALGMFVVVILVSMIVFTMMTFVPIDPISAEYGIEVDRLSEERIAALRNEYGLDDPLPIRYWSWATSALRGDLSHSFVQQRPVADIILERLPVTLQVQILGLLLAIALAIPLGVIAAVKYNSFADRVIDWFALAGVAMPNFWLGLILIIVFGVQLAWFPITEFTRMTDSVSTGLHSTFLPAVTAALGGTCALILRQVRSATFEELQSDYVRTARAKGIQGRTVVIGHALRNAMLPTLTVIGISIGHLLGGSVLIEQVFNIPGIGRLMLDSVNRRDYPMIQGIVLVYALLVVTASLVTDLLYATFDPRIKLR